MTPPTAEFTFLLGRDTLKLAETTLLGVIPFDPDDLLKLLRMTRKKIRGTLSKFKATGLASTTQAIFRELRESISNPNPKKVFFMSFLYRRFQPGRDQACTGGSQISQSRHSYP